jgi:hypothetical protein
MVLLIPRYKERHRVAIEVTSGAARGERQSSYPTNSVGKLSLLRSREVDMVTGHDFRLAERHRVHSLLLRL